MPSQNHAPVSRRKSARVASRLSDIPMRRSLLDLPLELLSLIVEEYEDIDYDFYGNNLIPLSSTCSTMRELCAPRIFWYLLFTNEPESANEALWVAKRSGKHFKRLHFKGVPKRLDDVYQRSRRSSHSISWGLREDDILCPAARELLTGKHSPQASFVNIKWKFNFNDEDSEFNVELGPRGLAYNMSDEPQSVELFIEGETRDDTRIAEFEFPWRVLMKLVWQMLPQNPIIKALEFSVVPKLSEEFYTDAWKDLLARLERLVISFPKEESPINDSCVCPGYFQYTQALDQILLAPARNITSLSLAGTLHGLVGFQAPINFDTVSFPNLNSLFLFYICLDESLVRFLSRHIHAALVAIHDCWACEPLPGDNPVEWSQVFDALNQPECQIFGFFVAPNDDSCFTRWDRQVYSDREEQLWDECDEALKETKGGNAFSYARGDFELGLADPAADLVLASLHDGEDQRAYDSLMELVKANRAKVNADKAHHNNADL